MRGAGGRSIVNGLIFAALAAEFIVLAGHVLFGWGSKSYPPTPPALAFQSPVPPSGADVLLRLSAEAAEPELAAVARRHAVRVREGPQLEPAHRRPSVQVAAGHLRRLAQPQRGPGPERVAARAGAAARDREARRGLGAGVGIRRPRPPDAEPPGPGRRPGGPAADPVDDPGRGQPGHHDRSRGRSGAAVSLDSSYSGEPITYTLIFDPATGALLEADETLSDRPHHLDALKGSVVSFTTFQRSGYVASRSTAP